MCSKDTGGGKQTHGWCDALGLIFLREKNPEGIDGLTKGGLRVVFFCTAQLAKLLMPLRVQPTQGCRIRRCAFRYDSHKTEYFLVFPKQENGKK